MSDTGAQATAIIAEIANALSAYGPAQDGYEPISGVANGRHPFVMVFNPVGTAAEISDAFQQTNETINWSIILVRDKGSGPQMRTDVEALKDEINGSVGLGGIVDKVFVTEWATDEVRTDKTVGALVLTLQRVVE